MPMDEGVIREILDALVEQNKALLNHQQDIANLHGYASRQASNIWALSNNFNKSAADYEMEVFNEKKRTGNTGQKSATGNKKIIVNMTSFPQRMYEVKYAMFSLVRQSLVPDKFILWLAQEEFPGGLSDIAPSLLELFNLWEVEIRWCDKPFKSHKKYRWAMREFPEDIIVTADDDVFYKKDWLEIMYKAYLEHECIIAHRCTRASVNETSDGLISYEQWPDLKQGSDESYCNFFTSVGGVLYPPHAVHEDALDDEKMQKLAFYNDDIWMWCMAVLKGTKVFVPENCQFDVENINTLRSCFLNGEETLSLMNVKENRNDIWVKNVLSEYPEILKKLMEED